MSVMSASLPPKEVAERRALQSIVPTIIIHDMRIADSFYRWHSESIHICRVVLPAANANFWWPSTNRYKVRLTSEISSERKCWR